LRLRIIDRKRLHRLRPHPFGLRLCPDLRGLGL
jgi:hypothetical protein